MDPPEGHRAGREQGMLSEAEAQRLRAEVHAAMVARRYDLARAKLQELVQRSRGTWPGVAQPPVLLCYPAPGGRAGWGKWR